MRNTGIVEMPHSHSLFHKKYVDAPLLCTIHYVAVAQFEYQLWAVTVGFLHVVDYIVILNNSDLEVITEDFIHRRLCRKLESIVVNKHRRVVYEWFNKSEVLS